MQNLDYQKMKNLFQEITPPYSYLFIDELDKNIELVTKRSGDKKIRIASKSIRSVETLKYILEKLGNRCSGLMCYHLDEILWLSTKMKTSFLMGYPQLPNNEQAAKLAELSNQDIIIVHMIDSEEQVHKLNSIAKEHNTVFQICVDLDMSLKLPGLNFGVFRSPIDNFVKVKNLFEVIKNADSLKCVGLMGYEAQIAGVGDTVYNNPIMNWIIGMLKKLSYKKVYGLRGYANDLAKEYFNLDFVNGGGTGSLEMTAKDKAVTEVTAGSAFYAPALFDHYHKRFNPSLGFAMGVQRRPQNNMLTVHGGGYIASGAIGIEKAPVISFPKSAKLHKNEMAGEVQTPIIYKEANKIEIGDPIFFRHSKAGELLERFNEFHIVKNNKIEQTWKSYRGESKCFL